ncbi:MAG: sensor domain-containing diguanylate cyclase [Betaproteobacteria bacterium]
MRHADGSQAGSENKVAGGDSKTGTPDKSATSTLGAAIDPALCPGLMESPAHFLDALSQSMGAMVAFIDTGERILYSNHHLAAWFGLQPQDLLGKTLLEFYGEDAYAAFAPRIHRALQGEPVSYERELRRADGTAPWISVDLRPHYDVQGKLLGIIASSLAVAELRQTRDQLDKAMQVQAFHMDNSPLAVIEWSDKVEVRRWSGQAEAIFGWKTDEAVGLRADELKLVHPDWYATIRASTLELLEGRAKRNRMISRNRTKSGAYIYCEWFNGAFIDSAGRTQGILSLAQDVTLRVEAEEQLRYTAVHDALTGLQNRQSLIARLDHALARVRRSAEPLALLFIDLDEFKAVNDRHGHAVGDTFLQQVAERLKSSIREADTVARIGGDEFVVLLEAEVDADTPAAICARIHAGFAQGFNVDALAFKSSASIGVSLFPADGNSADQLLASADRAMYKAKHSR